MSQIQEIKRLIRAASNGKSNAVQAMLDGGIDVDAQDSPGNRAVNVAAKGGHLEVVRLLVDRGCKLEERDGTGRIPLIAAAEGDHVDILRFLLDAGAEVNCGGGGGRTALMECANSNSVSSARLLLEFGANVNLQSGNGVTALHEAVFCACEEYEEPEENEMVPLLVSAGANIHAVDNDEMTPLKLAEQYADEIDYTGLLSV